MHSLLEATTGRQSGSIGVKPITVNLGAEISGVDLRNPLDAETQHALRAALFEHEVIVFRDQELTLEQYIEAARMFGDLDGAAKSMFLEPHDSNPLVEILENDEKRPPYANKWHTDLTWKKDPPWGACNYMCEVPETGGDTMWASMTGAYEMLSPGLKAYLEDKTATHTWGVRGLGALVALEEKKGKERMRKAQNDFPPVTHPVIRTHPETGKKLLYVNPTFTSHIDGVSWDESRAILSHLFQLPCLPELQVRIRWTPGSVVVWDNRSTQHYALSDYFPQRRKIMRLTIRDLDAAKW